MHLFRPVLTALAIASCCVRAASGLARQEPAPPVDGCPAAYVIGPEDVVDVAVWENTSLTRTVPVRPDGKISLPLLNDIQAAGLTPMQLREALSQALTPYISAPVVSVVVREIHSFKVSVIGQVRTPGRYELKDRATALDVLALAGGLTDYAARNRMVILRQDGAQSVRIPIPYDRLTDKSRPAANNQTVCVKPGDVIFVP